MISSWIKYVRGFAIPTWVYMPVHLPDVTAKISSVNILDRNFFKKIDIND